MHASLSELAIPIGDGLEDPEMLAVVSSAVAIEAHDHQLLLFVHRRQGIDDLSQHRVAGQRSHLAVEVHVEAAQQPILAREVRRGRRQCFSQIAKSGFSNSTGRHVGKLRLNKQSRVEEVENGLERQPASVRIRQHYGLRPAFQIDTGAVPYVNNSDGLQSSQ